MSRRQRLGQIRLKDLFVVTASVALWLFSWFGNAALDMNQNPIQGSILIGLRIVPACIALGILLHRWMWFAKVGAITWVIILAYYLLFTPAIH
jgi:hypothetical protein